MADKYTEQRLTNWARANRECFRVQKGATQAFCESLRYLYGMPEEEDGHIARACTRIRSIDIDDANRIDQAYRSQDLRMIHKRLLRMYYISNLPPKAIEKRLSLADRTFSRCKEEAIYKLMSIVSANEERLEKTAELR